MILDNMLMQPDSDLVRDRLHWKYEDFHLYNYNPFEKSKLPHNTILVYQEHIYKGGKLNLHCIVSKEILRSTIGYKYLVNDFKLHFQRATKEPA